MIIKGEEYTFIKDFREVDKYRHSFNELTRRVYGFDFEDWYQQGFWTDRYSPYSLVYKDNIVANVSVNTMEFLVENKPLKAIQLGTVMTDPGFRYRGLSKVLMELALNDMEERNELLYLYANDTVTDFYPRFGFKKAQEYIHSAIFEKEVAKYNFNKLNIKDVKDREILMRLIINTIPVSRISMVNNTELVMFYLSSFMSEDIYYSKELDIIALVEYEGKEMLLIDIFCENSFNLNEIIPSLLIADSMKVTLGFTPWDNKGYQITINESDGTFFTMKGSLNLEGRFPILSHT